jgi:hypothetical protein
MRCPKCSGPVTREDMIAPLGWTSFVCHGCKTQLDATKLSQSLIILAAGLAATGVAWCLSALGLGGLVSIIGMGVTLLSGVYVGMGAFAHLTVHASGHASIVS